MSGTVNIKVLSKTSNTLEFLFSSKLSKQCIESMKENKQLSNTLSYFRGFCTDIPNTPLKVANMFRKILQSEIPTLAIDSVDIQINESCLNDESIALRIGLIPLCMDSSDKFILKGSCSCTDECSQCCVQFTLEVPPKNEVQDVNSSQLISQDPSIVCMPNILITRLDPGKTLKISAVAKKSTCHEHAKWSPVCIVLFEPQDTDYKFYVETNESLPVMYILQTGAQILQNKLKLNTPIKIYE